MCRLFLCLCDDKNRYIPMDIFPADLMDNEPQVFTDIYDAVFSFHPASEGRGSIATPNTYISHEDILAWYAQAKLEIARLEILGGVRIEHTRNAMRR